MTLYPLSPYDMWKLDTPPYCEYPEDEDDEEEPDYDPDEDGYVVRRPRRLRRHDTRR